tara:strand:+ start:121 stop:570 length:450 start_codon:yes stop_codon:yes gene_type:complete
MISIALYKPDIPQNTAAILRLSACLKIKVHIIEPCAFNLADPRFKRVIMDYNRFITLKKYHDYDSFDNDNHNSRIILMTTKGKKYYHKFKFHKDDILLYGNESSGVPMFIHKKIKTKLKIPMSKKTRSLNISSAVAISASEALRQTNQI